MSQAYQLQSLDVVSKKEPSEGMRLARVIRKTTKEGVKTKDSEGCFVPSLAWSDSIVDAVSDNAVLQDAILNMLESVQDRIIRKCSDNSRSPCDADINITGILAQLAEEQEAEGTGRLSKESIAAFFTQSLQDRLTVVFAEKLGYSENPAEEQIAKLNQVIAGYRDTLCKLSAPSCNLQPAVVEKLQGVLKYAEQGDTMAQRLNAKLAKLCKVQEDTLLGL